MTYEIFLKTGRSETQIGEGTVRVTEARYSSQIDYEIKLAENYYRCSKEMYENISSNILAGKTPKHIRMTAGVSTKNDDSYFFEAETVEVTWVC